MSGGRVLSRNRSVMAIQNNPVEAAVQGQNLHVENINDAILISLDDLHKITKRLSSIEYEINLLSFSCFL